MASSTCVKVGTPCTTATSTTGTSAGTKKIHDAVDSPWLPTLQSELERIAARADSDDPRIIREPGGRLVTIRGDICICPRCTSLLPLHGTGEGDDVF